MKEIKLTQGKIALVDNEDFLWLSQWKWQLSTTDTGHQYAYRQKMVNRKSYYFSMHREILKYAGNNINELLTDHVDGNGLNNRRMNLRVATNSQNQMNRRLILNRSGYKGVTPYRTGKWRASTKFNQKNIHLGYFDSKEKAAMAYNNFAIENYGQFAKLNQIGGSVL